ncbi:MAG: amidohydrolase [Armatimonadetes bacterium]|nr:amidohydrolase [Armatimonadota bacterium]
MVNQQPDINFFDCNAQIGRYSVRHPEALTTADELTKEMEYIGISEALVYHSMAKEYAPSVGNEMLIQEIKGKPLHPCWVVMPHHTGEMPPPDELLAQMRKKGVRALRAFPVLHQFRLSKWCSGELLEMIEANNIPLFLDMDQTSWEDVAQILRDYPKINLILLRTSYRIDRYIYPLFEKYEGLRIETATYQVNFGIEEVCRRFGAYRLLFGTGLPFTEAGPSIAQIAYADISDEEKAMIAGKNLCNLLQNVGY